MQVLITGATGLIGKAITEKLLEQKFSVVHLSRKKYFQSNVLVFQWNPLMNEMDEEALKNTEVIINLAGENIVDKPFSEKRKQRLIDSRVLSTKILADKLKAQPHSVKLVINASGIGIYPKNKNEWMNESVEPGNDFIAEVVKKWETSAHQFEKLKIRTVIFRIANVLSMKGGAFPKLLQPLNFFIAPVFGKGDQQFSWIHIDDLCEMILKAIKDEKMQGIFNAVSDETVTNEKFIDEMRKGKSALKIKVPPFVLKLILGERADLLLDSIKVSPKKIITYGFKFKYSSLNSTLKNLLSK